MPDASATPPVYREPSAGRSRALVPPALDQQSATTAFDTVAGPLHRAVLLRHGRRRRRRGGARARSQANRALLRRRQARASSASASIRPTRREGRVRREHARASATSGISTAPSAGSTAPSRATPTPASRSVPMRRFWMRARSDAARAARRSRSRRTAATGHAVFGLSRAPAAAVDALRRLRAAGAGPDRCPNVFEPELCQHLIDLYEQHGGEESGFMREVDGKTVARPRPRPQAPHATTSSTTQT